MNVYEIVGLGIIYLVGGQIFNLVYVLVFRPQPGKGKVMLGLTGLFWPFLLVADLVMSIAYGWGQVTAKIWERFPVTDD